MGLEEATKTKPADFPLAIIVDLQGLDHGYSARLYPYVVKKLIYSSQFHAM